ncbi:MAG TPA: TadE/TadG family type IV pilus assembly protein [Acidimicrobiia bacterium]|nr:TadE/TadG family type IV pilus assembly protein [Acidimicrobiia bacterium]
MSVAVNIRSPRCLRHDERGTAVVEFAIASVVLLVLLFGIISYGYMLSFKQGLTQAAAEGARAAAVVSNASAPGQAATAVVPALHAFNKSCTSAGMSCTYSTAAADTGCAAGTNCIRVQITYDYKNYPLMPKFPGLGLLLPDTLTATSIAQTN